MKRVLLVVFFMWSALAWAADDASTVRIAQADGSVEVSRSGASTWQPAKDGAVLERGDRIRAGEKSGALLMWSNGSMVKLYPNTELALAGVTYDLEKKMEKTFIDLDKGRVFVKAQVPEHLFLEMKIRMGELEVRCQGAEFALSHDAEKKRYSALSLAGRLVAGTGNDRLRIDDGQQALFSAGTKPADPKPMEDAARLSLAKVSKDLGGSLMADEIVGTAGGKLVAKIGGVANRRGNAPFKVKFKALAAGGSGKLKAISWDFGDGESASSREVEHTFTQGLYVVILRLEDENGEKTSAQTGISVEADCGC
jgi:PKD domain-containing protein/FecR-like protein